MSHSWEDIRDNDEQILGQGRPKRGIHFYMLCSAMSSPNAFITNNLYVRKSPQTVVFGKVTKRTKNQRDQALVGFEFIRGSRDAMKPVRDLQLGHA